MGDQQWRSVEDVLEEAQLDAVERAYDTYVRRRTIRVPAMAGSAYGGGDRDGPRRGSA